MFTEQVLEKLSYKCGCPLDIEKKVVYGVCPKHPEGILLYDGLPIVTFKAFLEAKKKKLRTKHSSVI